ncbi:hypothetical protein N7G274_002710 [Stereocaulon virgatum]|uniref:Uncharacterized protein n=1 Tax=Stereocaulon virgatum TaxID=373712 RepID=A0ABR4AHK2_9LECA
MPCACKTNASLASNQSVSSHFHCRPPAQQTFYKLNQNSKQNMHCILTFFSFIALALAAPQSSSSSSLPSPGVPDTTVASSLDSASSASFPAGTYVSEYFLLH